MLGLIFIYFIGKIFYDLSVMFTKSKWLFAFLGVAVYFGATFAFGMVYIIIAQILGYTVDQASIEKFTGLKIFGVVFGFVICYLFYYFLKKNWQREYDTNEKRDNIDDIGNQE